PVGVLEPRAACTTLVLVYITDDLCPRDIILLENDPAIPQLSGNGLNVLNLKPHSRTLRRAGKLRFVDQEPRAGLGLVPDNNPGVFIGRRKPKPAAMELLGPVDVLHSDHDVCTSGLQHWC